MPERQRGLADASRAVEQATAMILNRATDEYDAIGAPRKNADVSRYLNRT